MAAAQLQAVSTYSAFLARYGRAAIFTMAIGAAGASWAADTYFNSASGNWDSAASWTGAKPGAGGAADAVIVFNPVATDNSTNNLPGSFALNRMEFISGTTTLSGNALSFYNNGSTGPVITNGSGNAVLIRNNIALGNDTTICAVNPITSSGIISGSKGLIKTGAGTLTFSVNNTFSGSTTLSEGTLDILTYGTSGSLGSTNITVHSSATLHVLTTPGVNALNLPSGASLSLLDNSTVTVDVPTITFGYLNAASGATINGSTGCMSLRGCDTAERITATIGSVNYNKLIMEPFGPATPTQTLKYDGTGSGATVGSSSGNPLSLRGGNSTGLATFKLDVSDSASAAVDLTVPWLNLQPKASGYAIIKQGDGLMQINGMTWGSGAALTAPVACSINGGTLVLNTSAVNGSGVNFSTLSIATGATLQVGITGTAGALYTDVANDGTLVFDRSDNYTYTKVISGAGAVHQSGSGTLILTGENTYNGGTINNAGTLLVNAPGSLSGSGAVSIVAGTLGGNGSVNGPVALSAGTMLVPGGVGTVGTFTLADSGASALVLNGNTLRFDLSNSAGVCDQIPVTGNLVLNGDNIITLAFPDGTPPAGTYTLITYAGRTGSGTLALNAAYPNTTLNVDSTSVSLTVAGSGITSLKWNGSVSGIWDTTTTNWLKDGVAAVYSEGDAVTFDDTAAGNFTISSAGTVSPATVTFNGANNYTLSASIGGASTPVIKFGTGTATLSGANTYGGGTTLYAGEVIVGSSANLPASGGLTFNGGSLQINGTSITTLDAYSVNWGSFNGGLNINSSANTLTVTDTISGFGSLSKLGPGRLALTAANTYSGGTTVSAGYLQLSNSDGLGSAAVNMTGSNCEVDLMGGLTLTNAITVKGVGVANSAGSLQSYYGTSNTWSGPVTLGENQARIGAPDATLVVSGVIDSGANFWDLVVRNPNGTGGTVVLAANNTYLGNTWIRCGTIKLAIDNALPAATVLQLGLNANQTSVADSTFDLAGFDQQVAGILDMGSDNTHVLLNSAASPSTLILNDSVSRSFAGTLAGDLSLVKAGAVTLTLTGTSSTHGSIIVSNGTLVVSSTGTLGSNCTNITVAAGTLTLQNAAALASTATLNIADGGAAKVNLTAGVNASVGYLCFDGQLKPGGTYGATGSGAKVIDDLHFEGSGILTVLHGNGGTLLLLR